MVPSSYFTTTHPSVCGFFFQRSSASRPSTEPTMMGFLNSSSAGLSRSNMKELSEPESVSPDAASDDSDESELPSLKKESSEDEPESAVPVSEDSAALSVLPESVSLVKDSSVPEDSLKLSELPELPLSPVNSVSPEPDSEDSGLPSLKKESSEDEPESAVPVSEDSVKDSAAPSEVPELLLSGSLVKDSSVPDASPELSGAASETGSAGASSGFSALLAWDLETNSPSGVSSRIFLASSSGSFARSTAAAIALSLFLFSLMKSGTSFHFM